MKFKFQLHKSYMLESPGRPVSSPTPNDKVKGQLCQCVCVTWEQRRRREGGRERLTAEGIEDCISVGVVKCRRCNLGTAFLVVHGEMARDIHRNFQTTPTHNKNNNMTPTWWGTGLAFCCFLQPWEQWEYPLWNTQYNKLSSTIAIIVFVIFTWSTGPVVWWTHITNLGPVLFHYNQDANQTIIQRRRRKNKNKKQQVGSDGLNLPSSMVKGLGRTTPSLPSSLTYFKTTAERGTTTCDHTMKSLLSCGPTFRDPSSGWL